MVRIDGRLISRNSGVAVESYAVLANLRVEIRTGGESDEAGALTVPVSGSARAGADGRFRIEIAAEGEPQGPVELLVSAPNGVLVHRAEAGLDDLADPLELEIDAAAPFTVDESDVPGLGQRLRVTGRVIDEEAPRRLTPQGLARLLGAGPLLTIGDDGVRDNHIVHVRIVTRVTGDGTPNGTRVIVADSARGALVPLELTAFTRNLEEREPAATGLGIFHF